MKKLTLTMITITTLTLANANATWFYYDGGNGTGWQYYGFVYDGHNDATQYYSSIGACASAYNQAIKNRNLP